MFLSYLGKSNAGGGCPLENSQSQEVTPVPIWKCKNTECKAWVREELASSSTPECPMCKGPMIRSIKHLPKLVKKHKTNRKKTGE
ncbi:cold-inducible protein YdjO-related protein [Paenibacillus hexagrammi]|uniref:Cold-shock protein n=1 Tax=Paenibacillus hexagrammi TaxID=2908839 RepID=A0ABY3SPF2_9BACL|nr:cold-inducible protein YdjO-related protein [Paenibacillus sp. YPD9-1]UJF35823.1 cold-shock protein [Paenibacillus sp. YPD9-1]